MKLITTTRGWVEPAHSPAWQLQEEVEMRIKLLLLPFPCGGGVACKDLAFQKFPTPQPPQLTLISVVRSTLVRM